MTVSSILYLLHASLFMLSSVLIWNRVYILVDRKDGQAVNEGT